MAKTPDSYQLQTIITKGRLPTATSLVATSAGTDNLTKPIGTPLQAIKRNSWSTQPAIPLLWIQQRPQPEKSNHRPNANNQLFITRSKVNCNWYCHSIINRCSFLIRGITFRSHSCGFLSLLPLIWTSVTFCWLVAKSTKTIILHL